MNTPSATPLATFFAHCLIFLAAWSTFIKYLFPIGFAVFTGAAITQYIYWDLWPVAHCWLAWALIHRTHYAFRLTVIMSVIEIVIIVTFFIRFLSEPEWSIWRTNWFINKVFVLMTFVAMMLFALLKPEKLVNRP